MTDHEPPRSRQVYAEFQSLQTRWNDNDQYGHLYNVTYHELFDEAMNRSLMPRGMLDHRGGGPIQVVVQNGCVYFRELSYPDQVSVGLRLAGLGRSSIRLEMGMFREGEDQESARARFVLVTVDQATRRPIPTPPDQRRALQSLVTPDLTTKRPDRAGPG